MRLVFEVVDLLGSLVGKFHTCVNQTFFQHFEFFGFRLAHIATYYCAKDRTKAQTEPEMRAFTFNSYKY